MRRYRIMNLLLVGVLMALALASCGNKTEKKSGVDCDSLLDAAYRRHQYDQLLKLADSLQATGHITGVQANYWRGYAYSRQRLMRLSESTGGWLSVQRYTTWIT